VVTVLRQLPHFRNILKTGDAARSTMGPAPPLAAGRSHANFIWFPPAWLLRNLRRKVGVGLCGTWRYRVAGQHPRENGRRNLLPSGYQAALFGAHKDLRGRYQATGILAATTPRKSLPIGQIELANGTSLRVSTTGRFRLHKSSRHGSGLPGNRVHSRREA
jgi:hypothetical protein